MSSVRQNYPEACEAAINTTINAQLYASYVFLSMTTYCDRHDIALPGFKKLFSDRSDEIHDKSQMLMKYQNERGGRIKLQEVNKPTTDDWGASTQLLDNASNVYKSLNSAYLALHEVAEANGDAHLGDFVEDSLLNPTVETLKQFGDYITRLRSCGQGLGEFLFDQELKS